MHVVAIDHRGPADEATLTALAAALGRSGYEARVLARSLGGGAAVVARCAEAAPAAAAVEDLRRAGFTAAAIDAGRLAAAPPAFVGRSFVLGTSALTLTDREGRSLELPWGDLDLVLRGLWSALRRESRTVVGKKFSLGRAIVTGGILLTRTTYEKRRQDVEEREGVLRLYAGGAPVATLRETALDYQGLGAELAPARGANFERLAEELRRRAPGALHDDRLARPGEAARLLGPGLDPAAYLDLAFHLVARSLGADGPA